MELPKSSEEERTQNPAVMSYEALSCQTFTRVSILPTTKRLLASLVLLQMLHTSSAVRKSHFVHWNTSNPIFRIDNTDHIIDVNQGNKPWEHDQVNIICPVYRPGDADTERYVIYAVSKEEYDTCRITSPHPRIIAVCNKPQELMYFTITFRSFTPTPGGMEFKPGKDYYFISTSARGDLHRKSGGHCSTHNMKVAFKVADNTSPKPPTAVNVPRREEARRPYPPTLLGPDFYPDHPTKPHPPDSITYKGVKYTPYSDPADVYYDTNEINHPNDIIDHRLMAEAAAATGQDASSSTATAAAALFIPLLLIQILMVNLL